MNAGPPNDLLRQFRLENAAPLAETEIANVWTAKRDGKSIVLKIYKNNNLQDEGPGFDYLDAVQGQGAVRLLDRQDAAIVLEFASGGSLGDMSRNGEDACACAHLIEVARQLHSVNHAPNLPPLEDRFHALLVAQTAHAWPANMQRALGKAQSLARQLLNTQTDVGPLHGDLHHDNIKSSERGYLAFDAKGVIGARAYDYANSFKNPIDAPAIFASVARITRLADQWHSATGCDTQQVLQWATAHCALSMIWSGPQKGAQDGMLLEQMLAEIS